MIMLDTSMWTIRSLHAEVRRFPSAHRHDIVALDSRSEGPPAPRSMAKDEAALSLGLMAVGRRAERRRETILSRVGS